LNLKEGYQGAETITCCNISNYVYTFFVHDYKNTVVIGSSGTYLDVYGLPAGTLQFNVPPGKLIFF
jgi:hypothetical protein